MLEYDSAVVVVIDSVVSVTVDKSMLVANVEEVSISETSDMVDAVSVFVVVAVISVVT